MIVACTSCGAKFKVDEAKIGPAGIKLKCTKCGATFPVTLEGAAAPAAAKPAPPPAVPAAPKPIPSAPIPAAPKPTPPAAPIAAPRPAPAPAAPKPAPTPPAAAKSSGATILVAHDSHSFCKKCEELLKSAGHKVLIGYDAEETLEMAKVEALNLLIVDIMLPGMLGFEMAARLKGDPGTSYIKIILAVSIFDPSAYRRSPEKLHGADDVIEGHHLEDQLLDKVKRLLGGGEATAGPAPARPATEAPRAAAATLPAAAPRAVAAPIPPAAGGGDREQPEHQKARRLARTIVSDIALYNQNNITEGLKKNNVMDLLKKDITEGTELYNKRVSAEIRATTSYLTDELNALFDRKRKELGLA